MGWGCAQDLTGKPEFSGFWKRTHSEGEEELMAAQGVPWALRKLAMAGDTYQRLTQKNTGLAIKQIRAGRELNWEYFYGKCEHENDRMVLRFERTALTLLNVRFVGAACHIQP